MVKKLSNKKGFTLAELLIVVAIIAVLSAIAVPLFSGALNSASDATLRANESVVRNLAIQKILTLDPVKDKGVYEKYYYTLDDTEAQDNPSLIGTLKLDHPDEEGKILITYASAIITASGEVETITLHHTTVPETGKVSYRRDDGGYYIFVTINEIKIDFN